MNREMLERLLGSKVQPLDHHGRGVKGWVDLVTLVAVLSGATLLGIIAMGGGDAMTAYLASGWQMRIVYGFIGLSAIWQWARQQF
jgi:hypothetical protein